MRSPTLAPFAELAPEALFRIQGGIGNLRPPRPIICYWPTRDARGVAVPAPRPPTGVRGLL